MTAFALLGCGSDDGYSIAVKLPESVSEDVTQVRVRVLRNCETGTAISGKEIRLARDADDLPKLGALPPGIYGIEVTAYEMGDGEICEVAGGCVLRKLEAGGTSSIPITLSTLDDGACTPADAGTTTDPDGGFDAGEPDGSRCSSQASEACNERDDDCDRRIDETFNTRIDRNNCGRCGNMCSGTDTCIEGECESPSDLTIAQIIPGAEHTCARRTNGAVFCWGANAVGQLGNGSNTESLSPTAVSQMTDAKEIGSGRFHTCALRRSGQVACWGDNGWAQLATASGTSRNTPTTIVGVSTVRSLAMGLFHSAVVTEAGGVIGWGWNGTSQLGRPYGGDADIIETPTSIPGLSNVVEADGGFSFTCARHQNQTVSCWGSNDYGQLGDGTTNYRYTPGLVKTSTGSALGNVIALSVGSFHACAVLEGATRAQGTVVCWGENASGAVGNGGLSTAVLRPTSTGITDAVEVSTGNNFSCARRGSGSVRCWGPNDWGQLGDGTQTPHASPVAVSGLTASWLSTDSGDFHNCAVRNNGSAVCWGSNLFGQLGIGTKSNVPQVVPGTVPGL